ncbi:AAA family ATPase [Sphingobium mellinum]|uniref:AAA family ATPase n=1 Tax=Sphingobium mellinum TaxID=1387166 RepID=UPI0030ED81D9
MGQKILSSSDHTRLEALIAHNRIAPFPPTISTHDTDLRPSSIELMLFAELDRQGIRYCHWKSNIRLDKTLCGREDIDLLVHPSDADAFQHVINQCGFKLAISRPGAGHAGVFHALAWDPHIGRLLDLHTYHQLVSGDSFVKSFRFPVEEDLLARTSLLMDVRVPHPTSELVLFLLRILLKHISIVETVKVNGHFDECRDELAWLLERSDIHEAAALCEDWFPSVRIPVQRMIDCIASGTVAQRVAMGMKVAWELRHQRRLGHVATGFSRIVRVGKHYAMRIRSRRNLSLLSGGAWIALVGPKGTGKSTLAKQVAQKLGKNLDVTTIHLGKPPVTWLSFLPRLFVPAVRKALPDERLSEYQKPERRAERRYSTIFVIGKLLVAHDRRRLLTRSMRMISSGTIVISDRCPATNATGLDGSAFDDLSITQASSSFQRWLMEWERSIYRNLPKPRLVLKLSVPIATAIERDLARCKPGGPDPAAIRRRWTLESEAEFAKSAVCVIDTGGDLEETVQTATTRVWQSL